MPHESSLRAPGTAALDQMGKGEQRARSAGQGQETSEAPDSRQSGCMDVHLCEIFLVLQRLFLLHLL